jgi:hypothetical protein
MFFPSNGRIVISEQAHRRRIAEKTSTLGTATKDPLRGGIEYEPDALFAIPKLFFRFLSLHDVFRERHDKSWYALGYESQRNTVTHPDQAAILALTDLDGRFLATIPGYQRMVGYSDKELRALSFLDITHA